MINNSGLKKIYLELLKIRTIEEAISRKYRDQEMRCPIHLSIGQEAIAVGICAHQVRASIPIDIVGPNEEMPNAITIRQIKGPAE